MYRIKQFLHKIYNIYRWIPVLWKDKDWDHYYIYEILKTKLKFHSEHIRKHGYHESSEADANRINLCVKLIDRVQNEYYITEVLDRKIDLTEDRIVGALKKHDKARRVLFKLLDQNIERWWD